MTKAIVYRNHTLGILDESGTMQPLHASVLRGAPFQMFPHPFKPDPGEYRDATRADFDTYRVQWHPQYKVADQS